MGSRLFLTSNALDGLGRSVATILIQLILVNQLGFSGLQLGVLNAIPVLLTVVFSVVAGSIVDRFPVIKVLVVSLGLSCFLLGCFLALHAIGGLQFLTVLCLEVLLTMTGIFSSNAQLVGAAHLQRANENNRTVTRVASADQATRILAPLITIPLVAKDLYSLGLLSATVGTAIAALLLVPLTSSFRVHKGADENNKDGYQLASLQILRRDPTLWGTVLVIVLSNFGLAFGDLTTTLLLLRERGLSAEAYVTVNMITAASGLAISFAVVRLTQTFSFRTLIMCGSIGQAVCVGTYLYLALAGTNPFLWAILAGACWSGAIVILNVTAMDYIANRVPSEHTGSAFGALRSVSMSIVPVGALSSGWLISTMGYLVPLVLWLCLALLGLLIAAIRLRA